jgi:PIN domain nuclease of toxin-antitoxin system
VTTSSPAGGILLDTHALLWWSLDPQHLSVRAASSCREMEQACSGLASPVSVWELAAKVRSSKLHLPISVAQLVERIDRTGVVRWVASDAAVWLRTAELDWDHRDPADRLIVATAMTAGVPILTKDTAMHAQKHVECVW